MQTSSISDEVINSNFFEQADLEERTLVTNHMSVIYTGLNAIRTRQTTFEDWSYGIDWRVTRIVRQILRADEARAAAAINLAKYGHVIPTQMDKFEVGAIAVDTWGYEQTNKDFYCIVARSGGMVTLMPMTSKCVASTGFMSQADMPDGIEWEGTPRRKRVAIDADGFSLRGGMSGGWAVLWDGSREYSTHYA